MPFLPNKEKAQTGKQGSGSEIRIINNEMTVINNGMTVINNGLTVINNEMIIISKETIVINNRNGGGLRECPKQ